jgi:hypothetical protein
MKETIGKSGVLACGLFPLGLAFSLGRTPANGAKVGVRVAHKVPIFATMK